MFMSKATNFLLTIALVINCGCFSPGGNQLPYDAAKVGKYKALTFHQTPLRGIESEDGIIYYVEKDLRNLTAYKDESLLWRVDVIAACGKPGVGEPEIRHIGIRNDTIDVTYGKHNYAIVDRNTGKATLWGAD